MTKKAIVTGIRGQDAAYMSKLLLEKGYEVYGADRRSANGNLWRLQELGVEKEVKHIYMDILEFSNVMYNIEKIKPDEIYNFAGQSFVGVSFDQPILTSEINGMSVLKLLEVIRLIDPTIKLYQPCTGEMFGNSPQLPVNEETPFCPVSPYGVSKLFAYKIIANYQESYKMPVSAGISLNHESPLRGLEFVTRKISDGVAKVKYGLLDKVLLGNLNAQRDWGYAKEYVEAMWLMLQQETPDSYVISTEETHSVREFAELSFKIAGIDIEWIGEGIDEKGIDVKTGKTIVAISPEFARPTDIDLLIGDSSKIKKKIGWQAKTKFQDIVNIMVEADLKRTSSYLKVI